MAIQAGVAGGGEEIGSPTSVKRPRLHLHESLRREGKSDGTSTGHPEWSGQLDGCGSQERHAKSWLCHPLGLSHRRKLFCLQASFAKEEKVVRKVLWKVQHVLEAKCSNDPGSERRLIFFLSHDYTPSGQISKSPSWAIRNPETCMHLAQIHFSLLK